MNKKSKLLIVLNSLKKIVVRSLHLKIDNMANGQWYNSPFGKKPLASKDIYSTLAAEARSKVSPEVDSYEIDSGYAIDTAWLHELALHTQVVIKKSELCYQHGRVLYTTLSKYLNDNPPQNLCDSLNIWETGTARGFSALCMAKSLADQKRSGTIITFDVLPHTAQMYWNCIDDHDGMKSRAKLLEPWKDLVERYIIFHQGDTRLEMPKVKAERIHFAFLDGAHTYDDVFFEFNQVRDSQSPGDIIVYDDYTPKQFPGIVKAVDHICKEYQYHRTDLKAHDGRGYVVAKKK